MTNMQGRQCICGSEKQCKGMSLAFTMLGDPRGNYVDLPRSCPSPHYDFLHRMNELRNAYLRHLCPDGTAVAGEGRKNPLFVGGIADDAERQQFIALHHFHPQVVREFAEAGDYKVPLTITPREMKRLGLPIREVDRVVDFKGQPTEVFFFVPNYEMDKAYEDLKRLSHAERSAVDITADVYRKAKEAILKQKLKGDMRAQRAQQIKAKQSAPGIADAKMLTERKQSSEAISQPIPTVPAGGSDNLESLYHTSDFNASNTTVNGSFSILDNYNASCTTHNGLDLQTSDSTIQHSNHRKHGKDLQMSQAEIDFPIEELPKRKIVRLPSCETAKEWSSPKNNIMPSPNERRKSLFRNDIMVEVQNCSDDDSHTGRTDCVPSERFKSVVSSKNYAKDASPMTPKRIRSARNIDEDETDIKVAPNKEVSDHPVTNEDRSRGGDARSSSGSPLLEPRATLCSAAQAALRERPFQRSRNALRRTKSDIIPGNSIPSQQQKRRILRRSKNIDGTQQFPRRSQLAPRRVKSDICSKRRSSDTSMLPRRTPRLSFSDSPGGRRPSLRPAPKSNDKTRKVMLELYKTLGEDNNDDDTQPIAPREGRGRRGAVVGTDGRILSKLRDKQQRNRRTPRRTKSDSCERPLESLAKLKQDCQNQSSTLQTRTNPGRIVSDVPTSETKKLRERKPVGRTLSGFSSVKNKANVVIKRIDSSKRALQQYVLDSGGPAVDTHSRSAPRRTRSLSPKLARSTAKILKDSKQMHSSSPCGLTMTNYDEMFSEASGKACMRNSGPAGNAQESPSSYESSVVSSLHHREPSSGDKPKTAGVECLRAVPEVEPVSFDSKVGNSSLESLNFEDLKPDIEEDTNLFDSTNRDCPIPADFHFSYPIPHKNAKVKKGVDWDKLNLYASFPSPQRRRDARDVYDTEKPLFKLPCRLLVGNAVLESQVTEAADEVKKQQKEEDSRALKENSLDLDEILGRRRRSSMHFSQPVSLQTVIDSCHSQECMNKTSSEVPESDGSLNLSTERLREVFPFHKKKHSSMYRARATQSYRNTAQEKNEACGQDRLDGKIKESRWSGHQDIVFQPARQSYKLEGNSRQQQELKHRESAVRQQHISSAVKVCRR